MGNRTECALLMMLRKWGVSYKDIRTANEAKVQATFLPSCICALICCKCEAMLHQASSPTDQLLRPTQSDVCIGAVHRLPTCTVSPA